MSENEESVATLLERVMSRVPDPAEFKELTQEPETGETRSDVEAASVDWRLPGIYASTRVTTNFGKVPAQLIRVGDVLRTRSGAFLPVRAIRDVKLDADYVERHPEAVPVLIPRGTLNGTLPTQDVLVSPAQPVLNGVEFRQSEMVEARDIVRGRRSFEVPLGTVVYYQFHLETTAEIHCEGMWVRVMPLT